jgi:hypothetical protein
MWGFALLLLVVVVVVALSISPYYYIYIYSYSHGPLTQELFQLKPSNLPRITQRSSVFLVNLQSCSWSKIPSGCLLRCSFPYVLLCHGATHAPQTYCLRAKRDSVEKIMGWIADYRKNAHSQQYIPTFLSMT